MANHEIDLAEGEHVAARHAKHGLTVYVWRKDEDTLRVSIIGPISPALDVTWEGVTEVPEEGGE